MPEVEIVPPPGSPTGWNILTSPGLPRTISTPGTWPAGSVAGRIQGHAYYAHGTWTGTITLYATVAGVEYVVVSSGVTTFDTTFPSWAANIPAGTPTAYRLEVTVTASTYPDNVEVWAFASPDLVATTYCAYGTQLSQPGQFVYYLTPGLIDLVLTATGELWAVPFLTALWFTKINAQTLCSTGPPAAPVLTIDDFVGRTPLSSFPDFLTKVEAWFAIRLWSYFCECTPAPPGGTAPTPYPPPSQPAPTGSPPPLAFTCDQGDLCSILTQLGQAIAGIQLNLTAVRGQVDLMQRQHVPFAYVPGTAHSGLAGNGSLSVQGILGLSVTFTTVPSYLGQEATDPTTFLFLGEIGLGTSDGTMERHRLTHNPQLILPIDGSVTAVHYSFSGGVVATILELIREP